jgi:phosphoribosyl 1,2-cyclic phosphodiesterase
MDIRSWGTRGSIPTPGPSTNRYGGNTSCIEVRLADGTLIILDAGSGIRPLGAYLGIADAHLLLSHYHWDHIQGMPFFTPLYAPQSSVHILGPEFDGQGPEELLSGQMVHPYFPAPASQWVGVSSYGVTPRQPFKVGSATVTAGRLSHPGPTFGYRIDEGDQCFVYMSDDEVNIASSSLVSSITELATGADLLLHDCQYTEAEYSTRHGWGHSTPRQSVQIATGAGVKQLMIFHHDPSHGDEQVEVLAEETRALAGDIEVIIGREGETISLTPGGMSRQISPDHHYLASNGPVAAIGKEGSAHLSVDELSEKRSARRHRAG